MKVALIMSCVAAATAGWADKVTMRMLYGSVSAGTATMEIKLLPDGSRINTVVMRTTPTQGIATIVRQESIYNAAGYPVRMIQESSQIDGKNRVRTLVQFSADGIARASFEPAKNREPSESKIGENLPWKNPAEFWFLRDLPAKGQRISAYVFDPVGLRWELGEWRYKGKVKHTLGKRVVEAHEVVYSRKGVEGRMVCDQQGMPLLIEYDRLRFERVEEN